MATENGFILSYTAGGNLSSDQHKFVELNSSGDVVLPQSTGTGSSILGVLQNKPAAAGDPAAVMIHGESKVHMAGSTLAAGGAVAASTAGVGIAPTTDALQFGIISRGSSGSTGRKLSVVFPRYVAS